MRTVERTLSGGAWFYANFMDAASFPVLACLLQPPRVPDGYDIGDYPAFAVTVDPNEPARLLQVDGDPEAPLRWTLCELRPATGYLGALAVEEPEAAVRTWSWEQTRVG